MEYIRKKYGVPAKRGGRVHYTYGNKFGTITSASGGYLRIRMDGEKHSRRYHPTWCIEYLTNNENN